MATVRYTTEAQIGIVTIDNPPVNAINSDFTRDLAAALDLFEKDVTVGALVVECAGKTFIAGGDIAAFDDPSFSTSPFNTQLKRLLESDRPIVVALHGTTLGGGLEFALACHYRVAEANTKLGLPEVSLGLIPGSFGTQLLPRLAGLQLASSMISSGKPITADKALESGIVDEISDQPGNRARELANELIDSEPRRTHKLAIPDCSNAISVLEGLASAADNLSWQPSAHALHDCLEAAVHQNFEEGIRVEADRFLALVKSVESRALRHLFFAERQARKILGLSHVDQPAIVGRVGVVGAGTMGSGIATALLNADLEVCLVDANQLGLERGLSLISANFQSAVRKGKTSASQAEEREARLVSSLDLTSLASCDMVIEAVFENMELKLDIAKQLGELCKPGAIIATNTSTLDVDKIAAATGREKDVIGTHFFSPAHIMRLLEVVRGANTAPETLLRVMRLAQRIGKTPVVCGVCYGFIGNRMAEVYMRENEIMQLEGVTPSEIDRVIQSPDYLGMAMGPNRMLDMAGIDVGALTVIEWIKSGDGPQDPSYRALCRALKERGDHGQKTGHGYYLYQDKKPVHSEQTAQLAAELAETYSVSRDREIGAQEIFERLFYSMVNEAAQILDEGIAYRAGDIDVVWTAGYGFPSWRGGPLFMADEIGLSEIVSRLDFYAENLGNSFGYWTVSPLLRRLAADGRRLSDLSNC